jgi:hypothetical protein
MMTQYSCPASDGFIDAIQARLRMGRPPPAPMRFGGFDGHQRV